MKNFLFFTALFFTSFLFSQNKDSLANAFAKASRERKNKDIVNCAEKLATYFSNQDEDDSVAHYYLVAFQHSSDSIQKARFAYHLSATLFYSQSSSSLEYAQEGYRFVAGKIVPEKVNLCNIIGVYYSLNGEYDSSFFYYSIALDVAKKLNDEKLISKVNSNLGDLFSYKGDYSTALKYQLEVLDFDEKNKDSSHTLSDYVNVGNTYVSMDKDSVALEYFNRAYSILKEQKTRLAGNLFNSMSVAYSDLKDTTKQRVFLLQSLSVKEALEDSLGISNTLVNLGELQRKIGNTEMAITYFSRAKTIAEKTNNSKILRNVSIGLGDVYLEKNETNVALEYFLAALQSAEKDQDLGNQQDALSRIYKVYEKTGDYKNALDYLKQYQKVRNRF